MKRPYQKVQEWFDTDNPTLLRGRNDTSSIYNYAKYILEQTSIPQSAKVLEIGCGDGVVMKEIKRLRTDIKFYGLDISPKLIDKAKLNNPDSEFKVGEMSENLLFKEKFDRIFSFSTIQYLKPEHINYLNENCVNSIKQDGLICHLSIPNSEQRWKYYLEGLFKKYPPYLAKIMVPLKVLLYNRKRYGRDGSYWHCPYKIQKEMASRGFKVEIKQPSDSWYRFDYKLKMK